MLPILLSVAEMENSTATNHSLPAISDVKTDISQCARYVLISCMVIIATVGIPANAFIVSVLSGFRGKTSTDIYIGAMAVTDLISSSVCTVFYILQYEARTWTFLASNAFYSLQSFILHMTSVLATLIFAAITHDRFKVTLSGISLMTLQDHAVKVAKRKCMIIAIFSFIYCTPHLLITSLDEDTRLCSWSKSYTTLAYIVDSGLALIFLFLFIITVYSYTKIVIFLKKNHQRMHNLTRTAVRKITVLFRRTSVYPQRENIEGLQATSQGEDTNQSNESAEDGTKRGKGPLRSSCKTKLNQRTDIANSEQLNRITVQPINSQEPQRAGSNLTSSEDISTENNFSARRSEELKAKAKRARKQMNRTTLLMFLLTLIYVTTWIINWSASVFYEVSSTTYSSEISLLLMKAFMINSVTNPVLNILLSSKFRDKARNLFRNT